MIPGRLNRVANAFMTRLLPRRQAIAIMAGNTEGLAAPPVGGAPGCAAAADRSDKPPTKDAP